MASALIFVFGAVVLVLLAFVADRLLLKAEERGFVYYRRRNASPGSAASAALEVQRLLEPRTRHVLEVQREARPLEARHADPPGDDDPTDPTRP